MEIKIHKIVLLVLSCLTFCQPVQTMNAEEGIAICFISLVGITFACVYISGCGNIGADIQQNQSNNGIVRVPRAQTAGPGVVQVSHEGQV